MILPNDPAVKNALSNLQLYDAVREDERHHLHSAIVMEARKASPAWKRLVEDYINPTITSESTREQLLRDIGFPLPSNSLVDEISDSASAVFGAQDRLITVQMTDEKLEAEAYEYLERIDVAGFISRQCHNAHFSAPNSLVVVDCPAEQSTTWPEPYVYLTSSKRIQAAEAITRSDQIGLLKFAYINLNDAGTLKAMFDDTHISVYERRLVAGNVYGYEKISSEPHNLPFCPAFKMWADTDSDNPLVSHTLIRACLALLDEYVIACGGKRSNDLKAAHAQFWHYKEDDNTVCNNSIVVDKEEYFCENGVFNIIADGSVTPTIVPCRACEARKKNRRIGLGSVIRIPQPKTSPNGDKPIDLSPGAGYVEVPVQGLEYVRDERNALADRIKEQATGIKSGPTNKQALNEGQILAIVEANRQIGEYLAKYYELLHKRIIDAVLGMRYGPYYVGCFVNYGRRFAALSGDLLMKLQESAKGIGNAWLVQEINSMIQDYYTRGDASKGLRFRMIDDLSKYSYLTPEEMSAAQLNTLDREGYLLSVGILSYIARFEREYNVVIERFGSTMEYGKRVELISEIIKGYVNEIKPTESEQTGNGGNQRPESGANGNGNNSGANA